MTAWRDIPSSTRSSLPFSPSVSLYLSLSNPHGNQSRRKMARTRRATRCRDLIEWMCGNRGKSREKKERWRKKPGRHRKKEIEGEKDWERARETERQSKQPWAEWCDPASPPPLFLLHLLRTKDVWAQERGGRWEEEREGKGTSKNSPVLLSTHYEENTNFLLNHWFQSEIRFYLLCFHIFSWSALC